MNKKMFIVVSFLLVLVAGAVTYAPIDTNEDQKSTSTTTPLQRPDTATPKTTPAMASTSVPGRYLAYDAGAVNKTSGTILLFFHAPWCPQCRAIDTDIITDGVPAGATIFKVGYDSNQSLRAKYGVTIQTTFVKIDQNGNKLQSFVAYLEPNFDSVKRELLP